MMEVIKLINNEFSDIKLVLAGSFEVNVYDNPESEVSAFIEQNSLQKYVAFIGFVPRSEIFKYIKNSDIALHLYQPIPWFTESKASSSFFEYMAASLPIVASDFAGFRSIIEENKCGVTVDPTNAEEIAEKIVYLLRNPALAKELGENGRHAFELKYNWDIEEKKLLRVYSELENKAKR